jgi:Homeodomain-like domain
MPNAPAQRRQRAIDRYFAGDPIEDICRELACSKSWLYTWRDRYLATDPSWSAELSRSPRTHPTKTPQRIEQAVVALRHTLAQHGKDCGAASSKQALEQQGIKPVPSPRTIYRILHRSAQEVTSTNDHHPSAPQLGNLLPVLTDPLVKPI